jgi:hypothetical protein
VPVAVKKPCTLQRGSIQQLVTNGVNNPGPFADSIPVFVARKLLQTQVLRLPAQKGSMAVLVDDLVITVPAKSARI